jgi:hypothetical protein
MQTIFKSATSIGRKPVLCLLAWLFIGTTSLRAQDNVYVSPGAGVGFFQDTVMIYGKMTVDGGTVFFNSNARVFFFGDTMRIVPGSTISGAGKFIFKGPRQVPVSSSFTQYLDAGGTQLGSITIDNSKDLHLVKSNAGVLDTLAFVNGNLYLNGNNFTVGNGNPGFITGYNQNRFVITNSNLGGTGFLVRDNVGSTAQVFPIGPGSAAYEPGSIANSGTPDLFRMRIAPDVKEFVTSGLQQNDRSTQTTWFIEEGTAGGSNVTLLLQHSTSHEGLQFTNYRQNHFISRYVGFNPNNEGDTVSITNWDNFQRTSTGPGVNPGYITTGSPIASAIVTTRNNLTYFGPFAKTVWTSPYMINPLPLHFLAIQAQWARQNTARVTWMVEDDVDAKTYTVQRLLPGELKFSDIRTVNAHQLNGLQTYFIDDVLTDLEGAVNYKVIANTVNGGKEESQLVSLFRNPASNIGFVMAPNPSAKFVDIRTYGNAADAQALEVTVFTNAGANFYTAKDVQGQKLRLNTETWPEGVYLVRIQCGAINQTQKLVVAHGQ